MRIPRWLRTNAPVSPPTTAPRAGFLDRARFRRLEEESGIPLHGEPLKRTWTGGWKRV